MPGRFQLMSSNVWPINKHVFVLEIDIQIPRHIFIIWCMRRRFSAMLLKPLWSFQTMTRKTMISEWETSTWPPSIQMGVTAGIFLASILLKEMRYLVYICPFQKNRLWHWFAKTHQAFCSSYNSAYYFSFTNSTTFWLLQCCVGEL
jgi:hypothetical protein